MSLNQQQINEAGEAFNDAIEIIIPRELRDKLVRDIYSGNYAVGNTELIAGARKVRQDKRTNPNYFSALDAYISILTAGTATPAPTPSIPAPPPASTPTTTSTGGLPIIPPLAVTDIQKLSEALWKGIGITAMTQAIAARIEAAVTSGEYIYADSADHDSVVEAVKEVLYCAPGGTRLLNASEIDVVNRFRSIIDQRIPTGEPNENKPMPMSDPRFQVVKGLAGASAPSAPIAAGPISGDVAAQVMAVLAAAGLRISNGLLQLRVASGFSCQIGLSENDSGLRIMYNQDFNFGTGWVNPRTSVRTNHVNPKLPKMSIDIERDAAISVNYGPPLIDGDGNDIPQPGPNAPRGKDILLRPGGRLGSGEQSVFIGTGKPGTVLELGVIPSGGSPNSPEARLKMTAAGTFVVDPNGSERQL